MTDFETHPIGTADKLKRLEAEIESAKEIIDRLLDHLPIPELGGDWESQYGRDIQAAAELLGD